MHTTKILGIIAFSALIAPLLISCTSYEPVQTEGHSTMWGDNYMDKNLKATAAPYHYYPPQGQIQERGNYKPPPQYHVNDQDEEKYSRIDARIQEQKQKVQENKSSGINATNIPAGQTFQPAKPASTNTTAPSSPPATYTPSTTSTPS